MRYTPIKFKKKALSVEPTPQTSRLEKLSLSFLKFDRSIARYVVLLFGAWTLLSYFFYIEFFPSFDFSTATSVLIALAFVTVPFTVGLSFVFLASYLFSGLFIRTRPHHGNGRRFKLELGLWMWFTGTSLLASSLIAVFYSLWRWEYRWSLLAYFCTVILLILVCLKGQRFKRRRTYQNLYRAEPLDTRKRIWARRRVRNLTIKQIGGAFLVGLFNAYPLSMVLFYFSRASELNEHEPSKLFNAVTMVALFTTLAAAGVLYLVFTQRNRIGAICIVIIALALPNALGFFTQSTGFIPMSIARMAKIGNIRANKVILSKDVCPIFSDSLRLQCEKISTSIEVCNVQVMSRIGSEAYLKFPGPVSAKGVRSVTSVFIPSTAVLSMELNTEAKVLRLKSIDTELSKLSAECAKPSI